VVGLIIVRSRQAWWRHNQLAGRAACHGVQRGRRSRPKFGRTRRC